MSEEERELGALRPSLRPYATALLANLTVAVVLLGWPYVRGRQRAETSAHAVMELSACLIDGRPTEAIGLALPIGERERFATLFEHAPPDWPTRCAPLLARAQHAPAIFLLPSPKAAERDLSEALDALASALLDLEAARVSGRGGVPEAPLEALAIVRGLSAALLTANDYEVDAEAIGVVIEGPGAVAAAQRSAISLAAPSRIPVRTGPGFFDVLAAQAPLVRVVAADGLGVAEVEVLAPHDATPARVRVLQLRRPSGARGVVVGEDDAWLAWTTPDATCDADPRHCALRATGLGRLLEDGRVMRPEHWIAAHPAGAIDRAVWVSGEHFTVAARGAEGEIVLRVIPRGEPIAAPPPNQAPEPPTPVHASAERVLHGALDWVLGDGRAVVLEAGAPAPIADEHGDAVGSSARSASESARSVRWVLAGSDDGGDTRIEAPEGASVLEGCGDFVVALGARQGQAYLRGRAWPAFEHAARTPMRGPSHAESSVHLACDNHRLAIGSLGRDRRLTLLQCTEDGCTSQLWPLEDVNAFDVALHDGTLWVASSGDDDDRRIQVAALRERSAPSVVAACWSTGRGMCGPARWARTRTDRGPTPLVLTAREGSDVLALVLEEGVLVPLPGLSSNLSSSP